MDDRETRAEPWAGAVAISGAAPGAYPESLASTSMTSEVSSANRAESATATGAAGGAVVVGAGGEVVEVDATGGREVVDGDT